MRPDGDKLGYGMATPTACARTYSAYLSLTGEFWWSATFDRIFDTIVTVLYYTTIPIKEGTDRPSGWHYIPESPRRPEVLRERADSCDLPSVSH
jgi:hypothetical protein